MLYLELAHPITLDSTKFMHELGGGLVINKYRDDRARSSIPILVGIFFLEEKIFAHFQNKVADIRRKT